MFIPFAAYMYFSNLLNIKAQVLHCVFRLASNKLCNKWSRSKITRSLLLKEMMNKTFNLKLCCVWFIYWNVYINTANLKKSPLLWSTLNKRKAILWQNCLHYSFSLIFFAKFDTKVDIKRPTIVNLGTNVWKLVQFFKLKKMKSGPMQESIQLRWKI